MVWDPFGGFSRGLTGGLSSVLAMEQAQRLRAEEERRRKLLDAELAGKEEARLALAGANMAPRAFTVPGTENVESPPLGEPSVSLDDMRRMGEGTSYRQPETMTEVGWTPSQQLAIQKWYPNAMTTLGLRNPLEERAAQEAQAAERELLPMLKSLPKNENEVLPYVIRLSNLAGKAGGKYTGLANTLATHILKTADEDPDGVTKGTKAFWDTYNANAQDDPSTRFGKAMQSMAGLNLKPKTYQSLTTGFHQIGMTMAQPKVTLPHTDESYANKLRLDLGAGKTLAPTDQDWLTKYDARVEAEAKSKVSEREAQAKARADTAAAALKRANDYGTFLQAKAKSLDQTVQSYEDKMAKGILTEKEKEKAIEHLDREIRDMTAEINIPESMQASHDRLITMARQKRQRLIEYTPGAPAGTPAPTAPGTGGTPFNRAKSKFFGG